MKQQISSVKKHLSTIQDKNWIWRLTHYIWDEKAHGKACTFYWWKFPLSLLAIILFGIIGFIIGFFRVAMVVFMLCIGYWYRYNVFNLDAPIVRKYNFINYVHASDGKRKFVSPFEVALFAGVISLLWYLVVLNQWLGVKILTFGLASLLLLVVIFLLTVWWKWEPMVRARSNARETWDKLCPPLVVIQTENNRK